MSPRRDAFFIGQRSGVCDTGNDLSLTKFDHGRARVLGAVFIARMLGFGMTRDDAALSAPSQAEYDFRNSFH